MFRELCGTNKLVCIPSLKSDLSLYYNWNITESSTEQMLTDYNNYNKILWDYIKQNKCIVDDDTDEFKTPLINNEDGIYFNVLKIDFQRAFTNYIYKTVPTHIFHIIKKYCNIVSQLYLPSKAKKFLYNYTLTNILVNMVGKKELAKLRKTVYDDVLYICSQLGDIIKTEVDGAYLSTPLKEIPIYDVFGNITIRQYQWIVWNKPVMIGLRKDKKVPTILGLGKYVPNIFYKTLETLVSSSNIQRDECVESFLYSPSIHILDWCFKTELGDSIEIESKNSKINLDTKNNNDIEDLRELSTMIDRDKYFNHISNIIMMIYELIG